MIAEKILLTLAALNLLFIFSELTFNIFGLIIPALPFP